MTRTVHCRKYAEDLPGLEKPPMPGKKGERLFETVSEKAWVEWTALQTRLINEKQLNMINPPDRKYLAEQLERFLDNEATDEAEHYSPQDAPEDAPEDGPAESE